MINQTIVLVRRTLERHLRTAQEGRDQAIRHAGIHIEHAGIHIEGAVPNPHAIAGAATDLAHQQGRIEAYEMTLEMICAIEAEMPENA